MPDFPTWFPKIKNFILLKMLVLYLFLMHSDWYCGQLSVRLLPST